LAAGYSKGGFYFHFRGKDDLLKRILESDLEVVGADWLSALTAELWSAAGRNEDLRQLLADRYNSSRRLEAGRAYGRGLKSVSTALIDLLVTLDTGLRVQQHFSVSSAGDAQDFVDSLLETLTETRIEPPPRRAREAS